MKIDFTKIEVFTTLKRDVCVVHDVKDEFANAIYTNVPGLPAHALAYKIYNSKGEEDYSEQECSLIRRCAEYTLTPAFIDAIDTILKR